MVNYPLVEKINFGGPEILKTQGKKNTFWTQVFCAYSDLYYNVKPTSTEELLAEPICFNERITIGNKVISQKHWMNKSFYCVAHLLGEDGKFLSYMEIKRKYDINLDFITYTGCKLAVKKHMRTCDFKINNNKGTTQLLA